MRRLPVLACLLVWALLAAPAGAAWRDPSSVGPDGSGNAAMSSDGAGNLTALWLESSPMRVVVARRPAGGAWSTATLQSVAGWSSQADQRPMLAESISGAAVATYVVGTSSYFAKAAYRPAGGSWQAVQDLPGNAGGAPRVAIAPDGVAWVSWLVYDAGTTTYTLKSVRFAADGQMGTPETVASWSTSTEYFSRWSFDLAVDPTDDSAAIVLVHQPALQPSALQITRNSGSGGWSTPTDLTSPAGGSADGDSGPRLAMRSDGTLRVAWQHTVDPVGEIHTALVAKGASTLGTDQSVATAAQGVGGLRLGANAAGDAVLWWYGKPTGATADVHVAYQAAGGSSWAAHDVALGIEPFDGIGEDGDGAVSVLADGRALVTWRAYLNDTYSTHNRAPYAVRRTADGTWSAREVLPQPADTTTSEDLQSILTPIGTEQAMWVTQSNDPSLAYQQRISWTTSEAVAGGTSGGTPDPGAGTSGVADQAAPEIVITTPAVGQHFVLGQRAAASYSCTDDVSVASCAGPVAPGAALDTATVGEHDFTVVARDAAGHDRTVTHGYFVDGPDSRATDLAEVRAFTATKTYSDMAALARAIELKTLRAIIKEAARKALEKAKLQIAIKSAAKKVVAGTAILAAKSRSGALKPAASLPLQGNRFDFNGTTIVAQKGRLIDAQTGLISDNGLGLISDNGLGRRAVAAAAAKPVVLAAGGLRFKKAGRGSYRVTTTRAGRTALKAARRAAHGKPLRVTLLTMTGSADGSTPAVVSSRVIMIR